jgi:hypothetical protein
VNQICKNLFVAMGIATATWLSPVIAQAQEAPQPAVIISIAEIQKQLGMIEYVLNAAGFPEFKFIAQSTIKQYTKGVDPKKPAGVMLYFNEDKEVPDFLAYVPVVNLDDLLDTIAGFVEVDDEGENVIISMDNGMEMVVKKVGDVAFMSTDEKMFDNIPDAPESMLEDLPTKYNLAAKIYGQRIPEALREQWLETIRDGYESQMEMMGEDSIQADLQEMNWKQIETAFSDMDCITVGMIADKEAKHLAFDMEVLARSGSELAKKMGQSMLKEESRFKGFLMDGSAMSAHASAAMAKEDMEQSKKLLNKLPEMMKEQLEDEDLSDEDVKTLESLASDFAKIVSDTLDGGKFDGGALLMMEDQDINFASGFLLANPKDLEAMVKKYVPILERKAGSGMQVELNSGNHKDVTFHRITIDVPDEEAVKVLGEQVQVIVGIGKDTSYLGFGNNPQDLIKKAMDGSGPSGKQPAFQMNFQVGQFLKMAEKANDDPVVKKMAKKLLTDGNDRVRVVSEYMENGYRARFEVQDGILSLIKVAQEAFAGGGMDEEEMEDDDF